MGAKLARASEFLLTRRPVTLVGGLVVLLVPTLFTVFPGLTQWPRDRRAIVLGGWVVAATIAVLGALRQSGQLDALALPRLARVRESAEVATAMIIQTMLTHHGFPESYQFRLFMPNEKGDRLLTVFDPQGIGPSAGWAVGKGVTGRAWKTGSYQIATGDDCISARKWGLTMLEQERYQYLKVVAAQPVLADDGRTLIAVLTGSSTVDDGVLESAEGVDRHRLLSSVIARVLSDIER